MKDHYRILEVSKNASAAEIKASYRRLVKKHHPDLNRDKKFAHQRFIELQEAYSVLSDRTQKRLYDDRLKYQAEAHAASATAAKDAEARRPKRGRQRSGAGYQHVRVEPDDTISWKTVLISVGTVFAFSAILLGALITLGGEHFEQERNKRIQLPMRINGQSYQILEPVSKSELYSSKKIDSYIHRLSIGAAAKSLKQVKVILVKQPFSSLIYENVRLPNYYKRELQNKGISANIIKLQVMEDPGEIPFRHEIVIQFEYH